VAQLEVEPIVGNDFEDIDTILTREAEQQE
jgi:nitrate reductase cytochrome c-type subunit